MWEDIGGLVLLAVIYVVSALVRKRQQAGKGKEKPPAPRPPVEEKPEVWQPGFPADHTATAKGTQAEGVKLEELLKSMDQLLGGNVKTPAPPPASEPPIRMKNFDSGAEAVALRRRAEAEARNAAWTLADHAAFDKRIRTALPAAVVASGGPNVQQLREAIIWKEILDRPVSLKA